MKIRSTQTQDRGFTMIELLVVISIIAVLMTIVAGVSRGVLETSKRKKAEGQIKAIEGALESYKVDWGEYPRPIGGSTDALTQSQMLYQAVTGDGTDKIDGVPPAASTGEPAQDDNKNYLEAANVGSKRSRFVNEETYSLQDPWFLPYHYMRGDENQNTANETQFDLWSEGTSRPTGTDDEEKWIKNW